MSEEIKAPYQKLEEWREKHVPKDVWENQYLQAYLKTRQMLTRFGLVAIVVVAFFSGVYFRG